MKDIINDPDHQAAIPASSSITNQVLNREITEDDINFFKTANEMIQISQDRINMIVVSIIARLKGISSSQSKSLLSSRYLRAMTVASSGSVPNHISEAPSPDKIVDLIKSMELDQQIKCVGGIYEMIQKSIKPQTEVIAPMGGSSSNSTSLTLVNNEDEDNNSNDEPEWTPPRRQGRLRSNRNHRDTRGSYICGECGRSFYRQCDLSKHIKVHSNIIKVHFKAAKVRCPICQKILSCKGSLQRHINSLHN